MTGAGPRPRESHEKKITVVGGWKLDDDVVPRGVLLLSLSGGISLAGGCGAGPAWILLYRSSWED